MAQFLRIERRGNNLVAVFAHEGFTGEREFCLTQPNLETRIRNLKRQDIDCWEEEGALTELKRRNEEKEENL